MAFEPIETQEDLDRIISARLTRERERFADYDDLKAAAEAGAEAIAERDALRGELTAARRESIAAAAGIPASLVVGDTVEEMQAHAKGIREVIEERAAAVVASAVDERVESPAAAPGPIVPGVGSAPEPPVNPLSELFG